MLRKISFQITCVHAQLSMKEVLLTAICEKKKGGVESHYHRRKYTGINNYRANFDTLTEPIGKQKKEK